MIKNSKKGKYVTWAVLITIVLQVGDYFISNIRYPLFDSLNLLIIYDYLFKKGDSPDQDIAYFNVGFDKEFVPYVDEFGDTLGNLTVTDRKLLADFLKIIKDTDYKYIFLDIRFEEGTESENDSLLFSVMSELDRFSYSIHEGENSFVPQEIRGKGAYSDFKGNYMDGFTRYELLQAGKESSALRMYSSIHGDKITEYGPIYLNGHEIAYNMMFVPFYLNDTQELGENGLEKYLYLGYEMRKDSLLSDILPDLKGKIVVIGDFENDKHQTYIGDVPGPLIAVRAYQLLERTGAKFSWVCFSITSLIYFLILYVLLVNFNLNDKICRIIKIKSNFLVYIISFIGYGFILGLIKLILYALFDIAFTAWLPAIVFSSISFINGVLHKQEVIK